MKKNKDYSWIISLVGGLLTIIAVLTPAAVPTKGNSYVWMWGLNMDSNFYFFDEIEPLIISILCSLVILFSAAFIILRAFKVMNNFNGDENVNATENIFFFMGVLIAISAILWHLLMNFYGPTYVAKEEMYIEGDYEKTPVYNFWGFNASFGVYGVVVGGILAIVGSYLKGRSSEGKKRKKLKMKLKPRKKPKIKEEKDQKIEKKVKPKPKPKPEKEEKPQEELKKDDFDF